MALTFGTLDFAVAFSRQTAFPLDAKSYFESLELAQAAAATAQEAGSSETVYYFGQTIAVVENSVATLYVIQPDKTLKEVGGNIAINENVFVKTDDKLDLVGFAGAVAGAQLVKSADGKLSWVKPDTTTVEGLSISVTALEHTVNGYTDDDGVVHEGLGTKVSTLETKVGNVYTKSEVDAKVSSVMRYKGSKDTYAELPSEGNEVGDVWNVVGADAVNGVRAGDNFAWNGTGWDNLGGAVVLDGYATKDDLIGKVDKVEGSRLMTSAEGEKLAGIATGAEVNVVKSVDDTEFTLDENGKLNIKALGQSKITGLADALAGKVSTEAGKGLSSNDYTDVEKEKLGAIEAGSQANILEAISIGGTDAPISDKKVDIPVATAEKLGVVKGSSAKDQISVGEDGIMSINTVSLSKIVQAVDETLIINGGNSGLTIGE
nr:MAG TPA: hypothetical protein [Caudoviricetes sp.]